MQEGGRGACYKCGKGKIGCEWKKGVRLKQLA